MSRNKLGRVFEVLLQPLIVHLLHLICIETAQLDIGLQVVMAQERDQWLILEQDVLLVDLKV